VSYLTIMPSWYVCADCGKQNVKLWREYNTFMNDQVMRCWKCAAVNQNKVIQVSPNGKNDGDYGPTDTIGWLIPAVPTVEGDTCWGFSSVPREGVAWWRALAND